MYEVSKATGGVAAVQWDRDQVVVYSKHTGQPALHRMSSNQKLRRQHQACMTAWDLILPNSRLVFLVFFFLRIMVLVLLVT